VVGDEVHLRLKPHEELLLVDRIDQQDDGVLVLEPDEPLSAH